MRIEILNRLLLAKQLLRAAEAACSVPNDQWAFTRGIILLHDAAESALGAIAGHLHVVIRPKQQVFLLDYYNLIQEADPQNKTPGASLRRVPYRQQMEILNTLRNNAKHSGILPDPKSNAYFPSTVAALISDICETYLGLQFSDIRLTSLIRDERVRCCIEEAEAHRNAGDYEKALISLGYAMFHIVDYEAVPWSIFDRLVPYRKEKPPEYVYPDFYDVKHIVKLIQRGIDPHLHREFHRLTPTIGRETDTGDAVYKWTKQFGHPGNWTDKNVGFCLNFCVDAALKFQREELHDYSILAYSAVYEDVIEPTADRATIWDMSSDTSDYFPRSEPYVRKPLLVLSAGQSVVGEASDQETKPYEWTIIFRASLAGEPENIHFGYVSKSEVTVTRRKKLTQA